jgi:hypothetical protein
MAELQAHDVSRPGEHVQIDINLMRASVFDLPRSRGEQDWAQWQPLTRWIARAVAARSP